MNTHVKRTVGKYGKPVPFKESKITFVNDVDEVVPAPKMLRCDHPKHIHLRKDRKFKYPLEEMYVQKWEREIEDVTKADILSLLPVQPRIICRYCYQHEIENNYGNVR
jgi:hypothetical protein